MKRVYFASKVKHYQKWIAFSHPQIAVSSTWMHHAYNVRDWPEHWARIIAEIDNSDFLIAYHEPGETPKGALIEIGLAMARGIPIYAINFGSEHTWQWHVRVEIVSSVDEAIALELGK